MPIRKAKEYESRKHEKREHEKERPCRAFVFCAFVILLFFVRWPLWPFGAEFAKLIALLVGQNLVETRIDVLLQFRDPRALGFGEVQNILQKRRQYQARPALEVAFAFEVALAFEIALAFLVAGAAFAFV